MPVCPANGHLIEDPSGRFCPQHGVRWFDHCSNCGALWTTDRISPDNYLKTPADHFCAGCGTPGPWLSRSQQMEWIRNQIRVCDVPAATRELLFEILGRLEAMAPDDTKSIPGWQQLRKVAPTVWEATKPVRDALIGESVRRALELL